LLILRIANSYFCGVCMTNRINLCDKSWPKSYHKLYKKGPPFQPCGKCNVSGPVCIKLFQLRLSLENT
jgi:hypothetical protein